MIISDSIMGEFVKIRLGSEYFLQRAEILNTVNLHQQTNNESLVSKHKNDGDKTLYFIMCGIKR